MSHYVVERFDGRFSVIDLGYGETLCVPESLTGAEDKVIETQFGYGVRLSAPGYLDCTDWEVFENEPEADTRAEELEEELEDDVPPEVRGVCTHGKQQHEYCKDCVGDD